MTLLHQSNPLILILSGTHVLVLLMGFTRLTICKSLIESWEFAFTVSLLNPSKSRAE